jgi:hypothetical protein
MSGAKIRTAARTGDIKTMVRRWDGAARFGKSADGNYRLVSRDGEVLLDTPDLLTMADYVQAWDSILIGEAGAPARVSGACTIKSRGRPEDPVVARRRDRLVELARQSQPATVRQLYYLAETEGLVPKAENGYRRVQHDLLLLRRAGRISYDWISDHTRWMRKSRSYCGIEHFLNLTISTYRRDLWATAAVYIEIWVEKDALAGVIMEETNPYDVPLMVARGCSSETYL